MRKAIFLIYWMVFGVTAFAETLAAAPSPAAAQMVWVAEGIPPAPILVPTVDPTGEMLKSAHDLAGYVEKISGQRPEVLQVVPEPLPARAVWVGYQPVLQSLFPDLDFEFKQPEEILIAASGQHLVIAGRDRKPFIIDRPLVDRRTGMGEFGTANAVSTFIHKYLGVRWLWPGKLGTDIPRRARIAFEPFSFRFHPPIRSRRVHVILDPPYLSEISLEDPPPWRDSTFLEPSARYYRPGAGRDLAAVSYFWQNAHRMEARSSLVTGHGHRFDHWSDLYREKHPEYFALLADGTRGEGRGAKLCVSNPAVVRQWVDNHVAALRENPSLEVLGATPNDGGGESYAFCTCAACRAMDHPDAPRGVLSERYVKFWNRLLRGLRERMPETKVVLNVSAYSVYKRPPVETRLENGIDISYVGHYPLCTEAEWRQTQEDIRGWKAAGAQYIGYRPNLFWYDGGFWGMPSVAMAKTIALFQFLAEINCNAFEVDSVWMYPATQAPQHYLMARLSYDPGADGHAILRDFYERGFGPAADAVQAYFELLEAAHAELVENPAWRVSSSARAKHLELLRRIHTPEHIAQAHALLERAQARTDADGVDPVYARRVAFVRAGLEFVAFNMQAAEYMEQVRNSQGRDREALGKALQICAARDKFFTEAPPLAFDVRSFQARIVAPDSALSRRMGDYIGPPRKRFIIVAPESPEGHGFLNAESAKTSTAELMIAQDWREQFRDDFKRTDLGDAWQVAAGAWEIRDGMLVAAGQGKHNLLLLTKPMPGLQRVEIVAAAIPPPGSGKQAPGAAAEISDLSLRLHTVPSSALTGYTLQFGARFNNANLLWRNLENVLTDTTGKRLQLEPGRFYTLTAEFDGRHVRLNVDGQKVLEFEEKLPLLGARHERIGICSENPIQVKSVRVFTAKVRKKEVLEDFDIERYLD